jgi:phenylacetate-CoA ligase
MLMKTGPAVMLNIGTDLPLQVKFLLKEKPDYLVSYPSNIQALAKYFIQENLQLPSLKEVRSLGEALGEGVRSSCAEAWDVPLVDMYSAQEVGYIALQCPERSENYHVMAENLYVEVVDERGLPCKPGQVGRVLLTTLHNFAMPLIRYEIGDYAEVGETCTCGRTLPVISQVKGRQRNMLVLPSGEKFWPPINSAHWGLDFPVRQFQFVQKSIDLVEVRMVALRKLDANEETKLISTVQETLMFPFDIKLIYLEDIPRSKGGKFEDFISEVI